MSLRTELATMLSGYRTTVADPETTAHAEPERRAERTRPGRKPGGKRASMPAKDLAPETMDPSPE